MQFINIAINHKGMARVMPALKTRDHIRTFRQPVHDFPFTFVTPLGANDNNV